MLPLIHSEEGEAWTGECDGHDVKRALSLSRAKMCHGFDNKAVAEEVGTSRQTVGKWQRFRTQGLMGLYDERRPGKPRSKMTKSWCCCARHSTRAFGVAVPWPTRRGCPSPRFTASGKRSPEALQALHRPFFVEKVHDIVGLYLNPPDNRWCSASTRRARPRRWSEPSLCCPLGSDTSKASRMATSVTAPPPSSPPSTWPRPDPGPVQATASSSGVSELSQAH